MPRPKMSFQTWSRAFWDGGKQRRERWLEESQTNVYCSVVNTQLSNTWELGERVRKAPLQKYSRMVFIGPLFPIQKEHIVHHMTSRASLGLWDISSHFPFFVVENSSATELSSVLLPLNLGTISVCHTCFQLFPIINDYTINILEINLWDHPCES